MKRSSVRSRFMHVPGGSPPDPAQQFAQRDYENPAKDDHRPGIPHQSVDQLVHLRVAHTPTFAADFAPISLR